MEIKLINKKSLPGHQVKSFNRDFTDELAESMAQDAVVKFVRQLEDFKDCLTTDIKIKVKIRFNQEVKE